MKKFFTREVKVGIMVVAGLVALVFGVNFLNGLNIFVPSNSYYTTYENLEGLEESAPVMMKGYKIGLVSNIIPDYTKEEPFKVVVSLNQDINIPVGYAFALAENGLSGKCIDIRYDSVVAKKLEGTTKDKYYKPETTVPSIVPIGIMDIAKEIVPKADKVLNEIDSTLLVVRALLEKPALHNTLESLEVSAKNIEGASGKFNTVMQKDVPLIVKDLGDMSSNLSEISESLNNADIGATLNTLDDAVQDLQSITAKINNGEGSIGLLINDEQLYNNLTKTAESANELVVDLKENPSRYVHFSLFGKKDKKK